MDHLNPPPLPRTSPGPTRLLLLGSALLMTGSCHDPAPASPGPEATARAFFAAMDAEDVEAAAALLSPDFTFRTWDGEVMAGRDDFQAMMGWDVAAEGVRSVEALETAGDTVRVRIREENHFTDLLELDPFRMEARLLVRDGVIVEERVRELTDAGEDSYTQQFEASLAPVLAWAREGAPELHSAALPGGTIRYDGPAATALLEMIRRYRTRTSGKR